MQALDDAGLPPQYLELELTESTAMENPQAEIAVMDQIHQCGILMSIDDFGTGYRLIDWFDDGRLESRFCPGLATT